MMSSIKVEYAQLSVSWSFLSETQLSPLPHTLCEGWPGSSGDAAGVPVVIYSGQLDLICCHIGTEDWIQGLNWEGRAGIEKAPSQPLLHQDGELMGFRKQHKNLQMYVLLNAGHMVPRDQPRAGLLLVDSVLQEDLHSRYSRTSRHHH